MRDPVHFAYAMVLQLLGKRAESVVGELADRGPADGVFPHGELCGDAAADAAGLVGRRGACLRGVSGGRREGGAGGGKECAA